MLFKNVFQAMILILWVFYHNIETQMFIMWEEQWYWLEPWQDRNKGTE